MLVAACTLLVNASIAASVTRGPGIYPERLQTNIYVLPKKYDFYHALDPISWTHRWRCLSSAAIVQLAISC